MSIATFTLKSASTQAAAPFSLGHAFKQGDVPSGSQLIAGFSDIQVVSKNAWPDGSLKFAVVSGRAALTADTPLPVVLSIGTPAGGSALTTTDLKATSVTAAIDAGAFGAVSWATTDWDSPFVAWVSGPKMSSWIYRKAIGSDAHLVGWLEVRLWSGGEVEVLPWVENGYFKVASPTNKSATYSFTLGGSSRFSGAIDIKHHTRAVLINGTMLSHWLGTDPGVTPRVDVVYLQATELVPTYSTTTTTSTLTEALSSTFAPIQVGNFVYDSDYMGATGYASPIGLLPTHDVAYLVCTDNTPLLYGSVVRNGFSVGRYPIHYRDETTNRVPRFSTNDTMVLADGSNMLSTGASSAGGAGTTPVVSGGGHASWDTAHSPSAGYIAYLLTGHWYHMETCQFVVTANWFNIDDHLGYPDTRMRFTPNYNGVQTRAAAWGFRSLIHALTVTPDDDTTLLAEFVTKVEGHIDYLHATYIAQANNPYGLVMPGENYSGTAPQFCSPWQQDFLTATYGYTICLDLAISGTVKTKLAAFFEWKAKSIVGRLGLEADFWYVNADPYTLGTSTVLLPDYVGGTGPWYASWNAVYNATYATPPAWLSSTEGVLGGEYTSDAWGTSMWGNLHPAIAYAVRHGVSGAVAAIDRMTGASNYSDITAAFPAKPVWSVAPAFIGETPTEHTMRKTVYCDNVSLVPGRVVCGDRGHGRLMVDIPSGFDNESLLFADVDPLAPVGTELRGLFGAPSVGSFESIDELGRFVYNPPAIDYEGTVTGDKTAFIDGVSQGLSSYSFVYGDVDTVTLTGANCTSGATSGTGAVTITAGSATIPLVGANCTSGATSGTGAATIVPVTGPDAPVIGVASPGVGNIAVSFSTPYDGGSAILSYIATRSPGGVEYSSSASPILATGLTGGPYTFTVRARNAVGDSAESAASNSTSPVTSSSGPYFHTATRRGRR
jgi:hypothetical protein